MKPDLISFDAAGTLVDVQWRPGRFAVECAELAGVPVDDQSGSECYDRLLQSRWAGYCRLQLAKDDDLADAFWSELTRDWLLSVVGDASCLDTILHLARERLYGAGQTQFSLFPDVLVALGDLSSMGYRMAVVSNWDYSLHRVLRNLGISGYFEHVVASLQEGPEKPDPALFRTVCERVGLAPEQMLHVGDHPVDDLQGARGVGMGALLLDRSRTESVPPFLATLCDLPELLEWTV